MKKKATRKYKKSYKRNNISAGVMFNAQAGLKKGKYKNISEALIMEHKIAKKLYGNR